MFETDNRQLRDQIQQLSLRVTELEAQKMNTTKNLDKSEQYSRRSCLRISSVVKTPDEVTDDIVISIASECGVDLSPKDIDRSHRLPTRQRQDQTQDRLSL